MNSFQLHHEGIELRTIPDSETLEALQGADSSLPVLAVAQA